MTTGNIIMLMIAVYPHMRGADPFVTFITLEHSGLPPHAWGGYLVITDLT